MNNVKWFLGGVGALIAFYLVIRYADEISKLVTAVAGGAFIPGVVVLQGRDVKGVTV